MFTVMACLCVLLGGPSYAAGADSLFIAGATHCEPGVSGPGWAWTDACLGGSLASARFVAPAGGAFGTGGVADADGSVAAHVTIEPVDATASAGKTGGPDVPGEGPSAPGTDPATGEPAADPSTNPTPKPAAATKMVTTTTMTNTTATKASRPKAATTMTASLPKAGDNCWIATSVALFLLGTVLLVVAHRC